MGGELVVSGLGCFESEHLVTHNLQLVLPELLFLGPVQKWEVSHMMTEDVPKDG